MNVLKSINPYSGETLFAYEEYSPEKVAKFLNLAESQFQIWKKKTVVERCEHIKRFAETLREKVDELAELASLEMGKPITQSKAEVLKCAGLCDYYTEHASGFLRPQVISESKPQKFISYQPLGCILAVMPWNFPYWQVVRFAVPTLIAGNVALLKHASNVPGCALKLEQLFLEAGLEQGVFQTLLISSPRVEDLIKHKTVKAVSLTGSGPAGTAVAAAAGGAVKKSLLELGGSDPYIILEDADLDLAVEACLQSRLQNNGQSCIAAKRFIVHESIYNTFKTKLMKACDSKKIGDPMETSTDIGPLAKVSLATELKEQVSASVEAGAEIFYQQKRSQQEYKESKAFFPITMLENIPKGCPAYDDEFFGPVFSIFKFSTLEEALELANDTKFGLAGGVFTADLDLGRQIAETGIESGTVFVNDFAKSDFEMPFGGVKESGIGRELSCHGMYEFINVKSISISS